MKNDGYNVGAIEAEIGKTETDSKKEIVASGISEQNRIIQETIEELAKIGNDEYNIQVEQYERDHPETEDIGRIKEEADRASRKIVDRLKGSEVVERARELLDEEVFVKKKLPYRQLVN